MQAVTAAASLFNAPAKHIGAAAPGSFVAIGAPSDAGNGLGAGARFGPMEIRAASKRLASYGHEEPAPNTSHLIDIGDLPDRTRESVHEALAHLDTVCKRINENSARTLLLGGDHAFSYAPIARLQRNRPLSLLWIDAHTDFSPPPDHGGHDHKQVLRRLSALENIDPIIIVGCRGFSYFDETRSTQKVTVIPAPAAITQTPDHIVALLPQDQPLYISLDIDAIDPRWAPGTTTPVPGGLSPQFTQSLITAACQHRYLAGFDVMEVNPLLDTNDQTAMIAAQMIASVLCAASPESQALHQPVAYIQQRRSEL